MTIKLFDLETIKNKYILVEEISWWVMDTNRISNTIIMCLCRSMEGHVENCITYSYAALEQWSREIELAHYSLAALASVISSSLSLSRWSCPCWLACIFSISDRRASNRGSLKRNCSMICSCFRIHSKRHNKLTWMGNYRKLMLTTNKWSK